MKDLARLVNEDKRSVCHIACRFACKSIVQMLKNECKADFSLPDVYGVTAYQEANAEIKAIIDS